MMTALRQALQGGVLGLALLLPVSLPAQELKAQEIKGRLATVVATDHALLQRFNEQIDTARLQPVGSPTARLTAAQTTADKVDAVIAAVMAILEMEPKLYGLVVVLLPNTEAVRQAYRRSKQGGEERYLAYYAPLEDTIYLSVADISLPIIAHEVAHAIIYHYFRVGPSEKIHELLAQYVATQIAQ